MTQSVPWRQPGKVTIYLEDLAKKSIAWAAALAGYYGRFMAVAAELLAPGKRSRQNGIFGRGGAALCAAVEPAIINAELDPPRKELTKDSSPGLPGPPTVCGKSATQRWKSA
jgi:hypothetical protein